MQKSIILKLMLTRRLLDLSREHLNSTAELSLAVGVNLLQDSVETFLLAVAEHVNASIQAKTSFEQYIDLINAQITPQTLPFRTRLLALNKLRINSKHWGIAPAQTEVSGLLVTIREFCDEVASSVLGVTFSSVSLIDLLRDGEVKELLRGAERAHADGDYVNCLINCRKALFVRVESEYDIALFENQSHSPLDFTLFGIKAPHYARSRDYISKNVHEPTEYIVFSHSDLDMDLMRKGIDAVTFWNVWRLTPAVYRARQTNAPWILKREFYKFEPDGLRERSEYVLEATVTMLLAADRKESAIRYTVPRQYCVKLKRGGAPIYEKATINSAVKTHVPPGITELFVDYRVDGLEGQGSFWHVLHFDEELILSGYLPEEEGEGAQ